MAPGSNRIEQADVAIVGGRCAGSPLAAQLAAQGLKVVVLEQATFPRPTLSSHVIQADALAFLNQLGVIQRIRDTGTTFMTRTDVRLDNVQFAKDLPARPGDVGGAACVRRHVLDPILAEAAAEAGASFRFDSTVTGLLRDGDRVTGVRVRRGGTESELRARLVVGADGRTSTVARLGGARRYNVVANERWYYWTYFEGADLAPAPTFVFHRWGDRHIFAGPADHGLYIVGVSPQKHEQQAFRDDLEGSLMSHARSCAPVARALADARRATKIYGITRFSGYFREPAGAGWVLLGDSGHFKDPAAGRGIGDAFHQGKELAARIAPAIDGAPAELDALTRSWGRWRDHKYADFYWMANDLGRAGPLPAILPVIVRRLYERGQADRFLELYSHRTSPSDLLTAAHLVPAMAELIRTAGAQRPTVLRDIRALLGEQLGRKRADRWPRFEDLVPAPERRRDSPVAKAV